MAKQNGELMAQQNGELWAKENVKLQNTKLEINTRAYQWNKSIVDCFPDTQQQQNTKHKTKHNTIKWNFDPEHKSAKWAVM